jgi:hypothetical protein
MQPSDLDHSGGEVMSHGGKGSSPRPYDVPLDQFSDNCERTFGKKITCPDCGKTFRLKPDDVMIHTCTPKESQHAQTQ